MMTVGRFFVAVACGAVFGFGLSLSGMIDPARVQGFLNILGPNWDPSLAFVLAGAVGTAMVAVMVMLRMAKPVMDRQFFLPTKTTIDRQLVLGAAIFGAGWGWAGFCPGPAFSALSTAQPQAVLFVVAMVVGMVFHDQLWARK